MSYTSLSEGYHTARKAHRCDCCRMAIPQGQRYYRRTYVFYGDLHSEKLHPWCWSETQWFLEETEEREFGFDDVYEFVWQQVYEYGYELDDDGLFVKGDEL